MCVVRYVSFGYMIEKYSKVKSPKKREIEISQDNMVWIGYILEQETCLCDERALNIRRVAFSNFDWHVEPTRLKV